MDEDISFGCGEAMGGVLPDGGNLQRIGNVLFKTDANLQLQWARLLDLYFAGI